MPTEHPNQYIQTKYEKFEESIECTATSLVGKLERKKQNNWTTSNTIKVLNNRNRQKDYQQKPSLETKMLLKLLNERLEKAYEVDQIKFLEEKLL